MNIWLCFLSEMFKQVVSVLCVAILVVVLCCLSCKVLHDNTTTAVAMQVYDGFFTDLLPIE